VANQADSMAYQLERQLRELGDKAPANEKARAEQLISETRTMVKSNTSDVARLRQLTSDMQQIGYGLTSAASQQSAAGATPGPSEGHGTNPEEDVVDAEFKAR
jgi:molecular chaperone DnaK